MSAPTTAHRTITWSTGRKLSALAFYDNGIPSVLCLSTPHLSLTFVTAGDKLLKAAKKGDIAVVKKCMNKVENSSLLIEQARGKAGKTALHLAAKSGHLEIIQLLLERGADINTRDRKGKTALHLAAKSGHLDITKLLLERGADASIATNRGLTARDLVRKEDIRRHFDKPPAVDWHNLKDQISKKPQTAPPKPPEELREFCLDKTARVFYYSGAKVQPQQMTIYDLIYDGKLTEGKLTENPDQPDTKSAYRWIHLPVNDVSTVPLRRSQ